MIGFRDPCKSLDDDLEDAVEASKGSNYLGTLTQQDLLDKTVDRSDEDDLFDVPRQRGENLVTPLLLLSSEDNLRMNCSPVCLSMFIVYDQEFHR